jgi:hypothetical protein
MTAEILSVELTHLYRLGATLDINTEISAGPYGFRRCVKFAKGTFDRGRSSKGSLSVYYQGMAFLNASPGGADHMTVGTDEIFDFWFEH